jgi:hypothetical protein
VGTIVNDDENVIFLFGFLIWFLLSCSTKDSSSLPGERYEDSNMPCEIDEDEVQGLEDDEAEVEVEVKVREAVKAGKNILEDSRGLLDVEYDLRPTPLLLPFSPLPRLFLWKSIYRFSLLFVNLSNEPNTPRESEILSSGEPSSGNPPKSPSAASGKVLLTV